MGKQPNSVGKPSEVVRFEKTLEGIAENANEATRILSGTPNDSYWVSVASRSLTKAIAGIAPGVPPEELWLVVPRDLELYRKGEALDGRYAPGMRGNSYVIPRGYSYAEEIKKTFMLVIDAQIRWEARGIEEKVS